MSDRLEMLRTREEVLERAGAWPQPTVIGFETGMGSNRARFILTCRTSHKQLAEMSRRVFNELKQRGNLETAAESRYRISERCQAWPIK